MGILPEMSHRRRITPIHGSLYDAAAPAGPAYTAQGVAFHATPFLETASGITTTNGTTLIASLWFKLLGGDGSYQSFFETDSTSGAGFTILRQANNTFQLSGNLPDVSGVLICNSGGTFTADGLWHHLCLASNGGVSTPLLYFDGVLDAGGSKANTGAGNIDFARASQNRFGARGGGGLISNADFAEVYIAYNQFLNISTPSNLQKFRSAGGAPVDLGATGATPTGTSPTIFFSSTVASWHVNKGTGGNLFALQNGPLTAASTNPP